MTVSPSPDPKLGYPKLGDPVEVRLCELALSVAAEATLHGERARDLVRVRIRVRGRVRLRLRLRLMLRVRVRLGLADPTTL